MKVTMEGEALSAFIVGALTLIVGEGQPAAMRAAYADLGRFLEQYIQLNYPVAQDLARKGVDPK